MGWLLALLGMGAKAVAGGFQAASQFGYLTESEKLQALSEQRQREALTKRQAIGAEEETWAVEDIQEQYGETKEELTETTARRGLIDSGIFQKDIKLLSENLATTLQQRARSREMRTGYESWELESGLGLQRKQRELETKYGEEQAGWGILGDVGSLAMTGAGYMQGLETLKGQKELLALQKQYYSR